jgi:hypothetical protein
LPNIAIHDPSRLAELLDGVEVRGNRIVASPTGREIPVIHGIVELLDTGRLSPEKRSEAAGNAFPYTDEEIAKKLNKGYRSRYVSAVMGRKFDRMFKLLSAKLGLRPELYVSLGAGTAFETGELLKRGLQPRTLIISDLASEPLRFAPHLLKGVHSDVLYVTADMDSCPVRLENAAVIVFEALHHTPDMHVTIDRLLARRYRCIAFVEPTSNALIRWAARRGLAQRKEYSGCIPGRLDLGRLAQMARAHNYAVTRTTLWELPEDYYRRVAGRIHDAGWVVGLFMLATRTFEVLTTWLMPGNMTIAVLTKRP